MKRMNHMDIKVGALVMAAALTLSGCGNKPAGAGSTAAAKETPAATLAESAAEAATGKDGKAEEEKAAEKETIEEAEKEAAAETIEASAEKKEDSGKNPAMVNTNACFIEYDGKVYFKVPEEADLERTALWDQFVLMTGEGKTKLMRVDSDGTEPEFLRYSSSWGKMALGGDFIAFSDYDYPNDIPVQMMALFSPKEKLSYTGDMVSLLDGDVNGYYICGHDYLSEDSTYLEKGHHIYVYQDGEYRNCFPAGDSFIYVGIQDNHLLYRAYNEENEPASGEKLMQMNLDNGELLTLGELPAFESSGAETDQVVFSDGKVYLAYSNYEGTGHFYNGSFLVSAELDKENSLSYEEGKAEENADGGEPLRAAAFYVKDGEVTYCDGIPGTAKVIEDTIGYYDEAGSFVPVAGGYGWSVLKEETADSEEIIEETEYADLVGDSIYAIRNISERAPEDDIGWRYAYRRLKVEILKIDTKTGGAVVLYKTGSTK